MTLAEGRRFRGMPAAERRAQRRARLVAAGLEVFGTRGYHASGIRDICAEAGLTERYFYESFKNREALFLAVFEQAVEQVRARMEEVMGSGGALSTMDSARIALRQYLESLRHDPRLVRVLLIDVIGIGADVGSKSLSASRSFTGLIIPSMVAMFPELEARGIEVQLVADGLVGSTLFLVTQWASSGFAAPLEHVLDHCMLFYRAIADALLQDQNPVP